MSTKQGLKHHFKCFFQVHVAVMDASTRLLLTKLLVGGSNDLNLLCSHITLGWRWALVYQRLFSAIGKPGRVIQSA